MTFNIIILHTTDYNFWPPSIYMTFFKQSHKNMRYSTVWYCLYIHYMAVLFWNLSQCSVRSQEAACYIDFSRPGSLPWWIRTPPSPPLPAKCETFKRSLSIVCTYINCFFNSYKWLLKKKLKSLSTDTCTYIQLNSLSWHARCLHYSFKPHASTWHLYIFLS